MPRTKHPGRTKHSGRSGGRPDRPYSDGVISSTLDPTLCPEATRVTSCFTQWGPASWSGQPHAEEPEADADRGVDRYTHLSPNLKHSVIHCQVIGARSPRAIADTAERRVLRRVHRGC